MTIVELARKHREEEERRIKQAKDRLPPSYHPFLLLLEHTVTLSGQQLKEIGSDLKQLGVWTDHRGVQMKVKMPYVQVDGRVAMMVAQNKDHSGPFTLQTELVHINGEWYMQAKYEGLSAEGTPCRTTGIAKIEFGGRGVNATNPVENAETSSIGRALAFAGYGLLGTGIASADEVASAVAEQAAQQTISQTTPRATSQDAPQSTPQIARQGARQGVQKEPAKQAQQETPKQDVGVEVRRYFGSLGAWAKQKGYSYDEVKQLGKTALYEMFNCSSLHELKKEQWQGIYKATEFITAKIDKALQANKKIEDELGRLAQETGMPTKEVLDLFLEVLASEGVKVNSLLELRPSELEKIATNMESYLTALEAKILVKDLDREDIVNVS